MDLTICRHIKMSGGRMSGGRCGSPALRGQDYCYFHAGAHRTIPTVNLRPGSSTHALRHAQDRPSYADQPGVSWRRRGLTGDALAIQLGLSRLIRGLWQGLLNARQGKIILAELHRAMADVGNRAATADSAVTSNPLQLPISGGRRAAAKQGPQQSRSLQLLGCSESRGG